MVRLSLLALGAGLATTNAAHLSASPSPSSVLSTESSGTEQTLQRSHQVRHVLGTRPLLAPPSVGKRDGSFHSSEYSSHDSGHGSAQSYSLSDHGSGGYTDGYTGGYTGYTSYATDGYGYTEPSAYDSGGGFLGNIGKYGLIIIPILLGITLLFLFPSVTNIAGTGRNNRANDGQDGPSDDLLSRAMAIYTSVSEDPLCVNRLFCEMGSTVGRTSYANQTLSFFNFFLSRKSDNLRIFKKAARSEDPQCHMLTCKAWEDNPQLLQKTVEKSEEAAAEKDTVLRQRKM
ncbi:uncharacterized protein LOC122379781 [Amphibalanus amphitrite]|uniref:uncharacterized protein LOC122379781 n=1 Tax=Amphibalanus amphitrite TaxID=1232801 RepID=UPI001C90651B|nr:uncharacterized protein LOC122379781 [Amphibalanus amphitrite]